MCDTIAIVQRDRVLFAKNSDRDANEGHNLEWSPRRQRARRGTLRCTWIEIPEADETYAALLSKPFWVWGAEMGTNECGVAIGNEAVFTRRANEEEAGLIGMDLVRLGLERAASAREACNVITSLLEEYGQGGRCGLENEKFSYHNSFIVADPKTAFVLETAGREWAVEEITGARSISNCLTIPDFAARFRDTMRTRVSGGELRRQRTQALAEIAAGPEDLVSLLQDHGEDRPLPQYSWSNGGLCAPCVHGGGVLASSQTTASWVSELAPDRCRHWATGTAAPCLSLFKPVEVEAPVPIEPAMDQANGSLWWRHEILHRTVIQDPANLRPLFIGERDEIQQRWLDHPPTSQAAFAEAEAWLAQWTKRVQTARIRDSRPVWVRRYWRKRNEWARLPI